MIAQCTTSPSYRCHTSYDTNWSLNAVMVHRETMLKSIPKGGSQVFGGGKGWSLAEYGLSTFNDQAGFESRMIQDDWGQYGIPVCISVGGIFYHAEIDG